MTDHSDAYEEVNRAVIEIVSSFVPDTAVLSSVSPSSRLGEDLDIDSVRLVDIWLDVEERFGITLSEEAMDKVKTLGALVETVLEHVTPG